MSTCPVKKRKTITSQELNSSQATKVNQSKTDIKDAPSTVWLCRIWSPGRNPHEEDCYRICFYTQEAANRYVVSLFLMSVAGERTGRTGHLHWMLLNEGETKEWTDPLLQQWARLDKQTEEQENAFVTHLTAEQCSHLVEVLDCLSEESKGAMISFEIQKHDIYHDGHKTLLKSICA